jgi:hypothetical protein
MRYVKCYNLNDLRLKRHAFLSLSLNICEKVSDGGLTCFRDKVHILR